MAKNEFLKFVSLMRNWPFWIGTTPQYNLAIIWHEGGICLILLANNSAAWLYLATLQEANSLVGYIFQASFPKLLMTHAKEPTLVSCGS